jgi:hypothetical protein
MAEAEIPDSVRMASLIYLLADVKANRDASKPSAGMSEDERLAAKTRGTEANRTLKFLKTMEKQTRRRQFDEKYEKSKWNYISKAYRGVTNKWKRYDTDRADRRLAYPGAPEQMKASLSSIIASNETLRSLQAQGKLTRSNFYLNQQFPARPAPAQPSYHFTFRMPQGSHRGRPVSRGSWPAPHGSRSSSPAWERSRDSDQFMSGGRADRGRSLERSVSPASISRSQGRSSSPEREARTRAARETSVGGPAPQQFGIRRKPVPTRSRSVSPLSVAGQTPGR